VKCPKWKLSALMSLESYRSRNGCSLEAVAAAIGLTSKGYLSRLERGSTPWPLELALRVEEWSAGEVRAVDLLEPAKAALLEGAIRRAVDAAHDARVQA
jgi:transcriptional regulator with XRE-family HTH domain